MKKDEEIFKQLCLKAKKTQCIVISVYPLNIPSIKKATEYCNN